jgi:hypothetical protein
MKSNSRIRFNPVTKEVEIEGSEEFVKIYFSKLQALMSEPVDELPEEPKAVKVVPEEKVKKEPKAAKPSRARRVKQSLGKEPGEKRVTNIDAVVTLVQKSKDGISTAAIKEKTGLSERQIWSIVARATKDGKIEKGKRGLYVGI